MPYLNRITLMGHIGKDIELRESQNGKLWTQFSLSTQRKTFNKDEQSAPVEKITDWHIVIAFGWTAKSLEGVKKGQAVFVEGQLTNNEWTKDNVVNKTSRVIADTVVKLDPKRHEKPVVDTFDEVPF